MTTDVLWLALAGPASLALVGLVPDGLADSRPGPVLAAARAAALFALGCALVAGAVVAATGALSTPTIGRMGVGLGLYLDALSGTMLSLVALVGAVVVAYSRNYMDGDPGQGRFTTRLCLTLAAVLMAIVSGNLFQFALAWIATSLGLNRLLLFYPERPAAVLAARKKFLASRVGDLCLIGAMALAWRSFHGLDYVTVFHAAQSLRGAASVPLAVHGMAILFVLTALLKSAQFPLHGWLLEVMEVPTPVSALLHAGIINAGGFLVLRMAPIIALSAPSLDGLTLVGGFTALFASLVMLTQTSVKVSLAYSTVGQMGFMMLECGLGAFPAALLHIVAHSLYKAHAFLSSGSVIDIARSSWTLSPGGQPHPLRLAIAIVAVLAANAGIGALFGFTLLRHPGILAIGSVVMLGLIHLISNGIDERPSAFVILRTALMAGAVAVAYFALQWIAERWVGDSVPRVESLRGPVELVIMVAVIVCFVAITIFQSRLARKAGTPQWHGLYAHVYNGFYVNTVANRLVVRFWPSPPPAAAEGARHALEPRRIGA